MGDLDIFGPGDASESYDPAAFERFKEQMAANASFIAAAQKAQQQQKKKDDKLAGILLKFIQSNQHKSLLMLAAKLLEQNIPAGFILNIIILGNDELKEELIKYKADLPQPEVPIEKQPTEFSLVAGFTNHALPLQVRAEIDNWGAGILEEGQAIPFRLLETAIDKEGNIKPMVFDLAANVLSDFFEAVDPEKYQQLGYETFYSFCEFMMKGIMNSIKKQVEDQHQIGGDVMK